LFFFFQAEDGIRDLIVTGVQTCALPISAHGFHHLVAHDVQIGILPRREDQEDIPNFRIVLVKIRERNAGELVHSEPAEQAGVLRSEERRVGKAWRSQWAESSLRYKREER